jgi:hypothetical protein
VDGGLGWKLEGWESDLEDSDGAGIQGTDTVGDAGDGREPVGLGFSGARPSEACSAEIGALATPAFEARPDARGSIETGAPGRPGLAIFPAAIDCSDANCSAINGVEIDGVGGKYVETA